MLKEYILQMISWSHYINVRQNRHHEKKLPEMMTKKHIMINRMIQEEYISLNIFVHLVIEPQTHAANIYRIKGETDNVTIIVLDVTTSEHLLQPLSKNQKEVKDWKNTFNHPDIIDIQRSMYPTRLYLLSCAQKLFDNMEHVWAKIYDSINFKRLNY